MLWYPLPSGGLVQSICFISLTLPCRISAMLYAAQNYPVWDLEVNGFNFMANPCLIVIIRKIDYFSPPWYHSQGDESQAMQSHNTLHLKSESSAGL